MAQSLVARAGVLALAVASALGAEAVAARHGELTTYAGRSAVAAVAQVAAGLLLLAAGNATWRARPLVGRLAVLAGVAWFAPDWAGWEGGPDVVRSAGLAGGAVALALVVHLAVAWLGFRQSTRNARALVAGTYLGTALITLCWALFRDPFGDPNCWSDCARNVFVIHGSGGLARAADYGGAIVATGAAIGLAAIAVDRLSAASAAARRTLWPVLVPAVAFAFGVALRADALLVTPPEDPNKAAYAIAFAVQAAALGLVGAGILAALVRIQLTRAGIGRLLTELGAVPAPGALEQALADALGDPSVEVLYWLPLSERYVNSGGQTVDLSERAADRALTPIVRDDRPVAMVMHDPSAFDPAELTRAIGTTARLAVDNERLQAQARAHVLDLCASRARIVAAGDAERRRLERDLHDGAQQRLVSLSLALRVARVELDAEQEPELAREIEEAEVELAAAVEELRELAHGIHPAVLTGAGFAAAVEALAERSRIVVEIRQLPEGRLPAAVETAAYHLVSEAVAGSQRCAVTAGRSNGTLMVVVDERTELTTQGEEARLADVRDRIGALDGSVTVRSADSGTLQIRAMIPCA